ncbi:hypothetical protein M413DRAFT_445948 [Hebeloma cylindrosporum]|uniref:Uncharacterized protein n=1 Tax=Hebeloma cylindrosporum TaxID=76867 RepID=A0A0C3C8E3_HEBCY|nr:hypothetical protein M413DRAFT_445948 [Hebeloma cylindrosporum h7]
MAIRYFLMIQSAMCVHEYDLYPFYFVILWRIIPPSSYSGLLRCFLGLGDSY